MGYQDYPKYDNPFEQDYMYSTFFDRYEDGWNDSELDHQENG